MESKIEKGKTIIIQSKMGLLSHEDSEKIYENLYKQMNKGLMIIPNGFEFVAVTDNTAKLIILQDDCYLNISKNSK